VDTHNNEAEAAEAEETPLALSYYTLKFGLTTIAVLHIQRHRPRRITTSTGQSVLELYYTQGNILIAFLVLPDLRNNPRKGAVKQVHHC
jgi:hypothetical protein